MRRPIRQGHVLLVCALLVSTLVAALPVQGVAAAAGRWCPPETGYCAENAFLDFWGAHGALEILGYPIDHARRAPNGLIIQFYERAVMEWHPQNPVAYQVLLARLGALAVGDHPITTQPPVPCAGECALFAETNHTLRGPFLAYWQGYGGLPVYGFPLTEQGQERNAADSRVYTVQYFERNRFEHHPEHAGTRHEVLLGRLGAELLDAIGGDVRTWPFAGVPNYGAGAPAPSPAPTPAPTPVPTPAPPASQEAAAFKAYRLGQLDEGITKINEYIQRCYGYSQLACYGPHSQLTDYFDSVLGTIFDTAAPRQCQPLASQIYAAWGKASGLISTPTSAMQEMHDARDWLVYARTLVIDQPGTCR